MTGLHAVVGAPLEAVHVPIRPSVPVWVAHTDAKTYGWAFSPQGAQQEWKRHGYVAPLPNGTLGFPELAYDRLSVPAATVAEGADAMDRWVHSWLLSLYMFYRGPRQAADPTGDPS